MTGGNFEQRVKEAIRHGPDLDLGEIKIATEEDGEDIFDAVNNIARNLESDRTILVEPKEYTKQAGKAVANQLKTFKEGHSYMFFGADVELADEVDEDPVNISNDNILIEHLNIDGNRGNNNITAAVNTEKDLESLTLQDVEFAYAPIGMKLNSVQSGFIEGVKPSSINSVDKGISAIECSDLNITDTTIRSFQEIGVELIQCTDFTGSNILAEAGTDSNAQTCIKLEGCKDLRLEVVANGRGAATEGITDIPHDPGGTDETIPEGNDINARVQGVQDIGIHISDAEPEFVEAQVDGEYEGGRTNQAFLVDSPNNLVDNAAHDLEISGTKLNKITETEVASNNAGLSITGHFDKLNESSTVRANGNSVIEWSFGVATPDPVATVLADTNVDFEQRVLRGPKTTNNNGRATIDWSSLYAFADKPLLNVNLEQAGQWYVYEYTTNSNGRYTGATIQVTDSSGNAVGKGRAVNLKVLGT